VYPYDSSNNEKRTIYQENKLKYETLLQESKKIEEAAKVKQKQKKNEAKLFKEMMDKLTNETESTANDDSTNINTDVQSMVSVVIMHY